MGVQGLTGFVDRLPHALHEVTFTPDAEDKRALVVDGNALAYNIARSTALAQRPMANTDVLDAYLLQELDVMLACFTRIVVVMDGPSPAWKRSTAQDRLVKQVQLAKHFHAKLANQGWQPIPRAPSAGTTLLPRSLFAHLIHVLLSHDAERVAVVHCVGEGDAMVAALAKQLDAYALTLDSDFFVYDCRYLPISGWTVNAAEASVTARLFSRQTLLDELGLSSHAQLCVWATLIGNDYTRHFVTAAHTGGSFASAASAVRKAARTCDHDIASCIAAQVLTRIRTRGPFSNADAKTFALSAAQYAQQQHEIRQARRAFQQSQEAREEQERCPSENPKDNHSRSKDSDHDGDDDHDDGGDGDDDADTIGVYSPGSQVNGSVPSDSGSSSSSSSRTRRRRRNRRRKNKRATPKMKSKKKRKKRGHGGRRKPQPSDSHAMASDLVAPTSDAASPLKWVDVPVPTGILITASARLHASIATAMHVIDSADEEQRGKQHTARSSHESSSSTGSTGSTGTERSASTTAVAGHDSVAHGHGRGGAVSQREDARSPSSAPASAPKQVRSEQTTEAQDYPLTGKSASTDGPAPAANHGNANSSTAGTKAHSGNGRTLRERVAARLIGVDDTLPVVNGRGDVRLGTDQVWLLLAVYLYNNYLRTRNYLALVLLVASVKSVHVHRAKTPGHTEHRQHHQQQRAEEAADTGDGRQEDGCQQGEQAQCVFGVEAKLEGRAEPAVDSSVGVDANICVARLLQHSAAQALAAALSRAQAHLQPPPIATVSVTSVMYACDAALNHRKLSGPKRAAARPSTAVLPATQPPPSHKHAPVPLLSSDDALAWLAALEGAALLDPPQSQALSRQIEQLPSFTSTTPAPTPSTTANAPPSHVCSVRTSSVLNMRGVWCSCWLAGALVAVFASHHPAAARRQAHTLTCLLRALLLPSHVRRRAYSSALDAGRKRLDHIAAEKKQDGAQASGSSGGSSESLPAPGQLLDDLSAWHLVVQTFAISVAAAPFAATLRATGAIQGEGRLAHTHSAAREEHASEGAGQEEAEVTQETHPWLSSRLFDAHAFWAFAHSDSCEKVDSDQEPTGQIEEREEEERVWSLTCGALLEHIKQHHY